MINDVYALRADGALKTASELGVNICLMHMQGSPSNMQNNPVYNDAVDDIKYFFEQRIEACISAGISTKKLILDPGFGFGKTYKHNLEILHRFNEFKSFGLPLLAGLSRKRMIAQMLNNRATKGRVVGSVMPAIWAICKGQSNPTSTPADRIPASSEDSNKYPETQVSLPITTLGLLFFCAKTEPTAQPNFKKKSAVIGSTPTSPRIPSVPK
jgi:hypothetical protein